MRVGQGRTNLFIAVRGDKSAMRPFAKLLYTLVIIVIIILPVLHCSYEVTLVIPGDRLGLLSW